MRRSWALFALATAASCGVLGCGPWEQPRPFKSPLIQIRLHSVDLAACGGDAATTPGSPGPARLTSAGVGFDREGTFGPIWSCPRRPEDPDFGRCLGADGAHSASVACAAGGRALLRAGRPHNHFSHAIVAGDRYVNLHFRFQSGVTPATWVIRVSTATGVGTVVSLGREAAGITLDGTMGGCARNTAGDRLCWRQTLCGDKDATCDGVDDDCDGRIDDDFTPTPAEVACFGGQTCAPTDATCNGIDDDCDGEDDDEFAPSADIVACKAGVPCRAADTTCDGVDDDCDGRVDEDHVPAPGGITCPTRAPCLSTDVTCDGADDDCDGQVDEDYFGHIPACGGDECSGGRTSCAGGVETVPCQPCQAWPAVAGGWMFFLNAYDFDVAADKLCVVPLVAGIGTLGGIACTTTAAGNASPFVSIESPAGFPAGCDTVRCGNRVALQAGGRVWATRPHEVLRADDAGTLIHFSDKPPNCAGAITALEIAGPDSAPRPFVICGPADGAVNAVGTVHEWRMVEGHWIDHAFTASTLGASPLRAFEVFFGVPLQAGGVGIDFVRLVGMAPVRVGRVGTGFWGKVGGIYMSAAGPFAGGIYQWTGDDILPVSDFTVPLPVENQYLGRYRRLMAAGTHTPSALPYKIAEGGGTGLGGPSPDGQTDILWILNESLRVQSYSLGPIPQGAVGPLDSAPLTR